MSKSRKEEFNIQSEDTEIIVKLGKDGKICYISSSFMQSRPVWTKVSANPHSADSIVNVDFAFETMIDIDVNTFKTMLNSIKESDPEYFEKGLAILQKKKEDAIKKAEEMYSF